MGSPVRLACRGSQDVARRDSEEKHQRPVRFLDVRRAIDQRDDQSCVGMARRCNYRPEPF